MFKVEDNDRFAQEATIHIMMKIDLTRLLPKRLFCTRLILYDRQPTQYRRIHITSVTSQVIFKSDFHPSLI
jgi:hypothetical protein